MNENPIHNPMNHDGTLGRRKTWMTITAIVLAVVAIAGIVYSVYAWQQNQKLTSDVTAKNNQIADLQKQQTPPAKTTPTPPADPYTGWQSATLKYEKVNLKYPSTWTVTSGSVAGGSGANPGTDYIKLVSPTGLNVRINTGVSLNDFGPTCGVMPYTTSVSTLGGSYYLGFEEPGGRTPSSDLRTGLLCTTADANGTWPLSKNVTSSKGAVYNLITLAYYDASDDVVAKPVSAYQSDSSYNDALLIIKSLSY